MSRSTNQTSEESRAYLQQRVSTFGKAMLIVSLVGMGVHLLSFLVHGAYESWASLILVSPLISAALWQVCARGSYSVRTLRVLSFSALLLSAIAASVLGRVMLPSALADMVGSADELATPPVLGLVQTFMAMSILLGMALTVALRAAIVPSSRARTVAVTIAIGVPVTVITSFGAPPFEQTQAFRLDLEQAQRATFVTGVIWWGLTTFTCSIITGVVHGLRREVREARRIGQYSLEKKIGEGGMGAVYLAHHALLRRRTAIKLLSMEKAQGIDLRRFEQEVQLTARLTHPNTVTVFDYGHTPEGQFYYAMELLDGANLDEVVRVGGPLTTGRALKVLAELAGALEEAHGIGLIHRDIKPGNVILCSRGGKPDVTKLVDFGLVKELEEAEQPSITQPGAVLGTPLYMSPETVSSPEDVGEASDIYSLGAVGYFLLTGHHVFEGRTLVEILGHHIHSKPQGLSERKGEPVPRDVEEFILRCLAKSTADRPGSAREVSRIVAECEAYGDWSEESARVWWEQHSAELASARKGEFPAPIGQTIDIALDAARRNPSR